MEYQNVFLTKDERRILGHYPKKVKRALKARDWKNYIRGRGKLPKLSKKYNKLKSLR